MNIQEIMLAKRTGGAAFRKSHMVPKARVYIHIDGETLWQNLNDRRSRPYTAYRNEVLPQLGKLLGIDISRLDLRWSQKAGCSMCPCSPGFIDQNHLLTRDVHVTITDAAVERVRIKGKLPRPDESLVY